MSEKIKDFTDLIVWKKSHQIVLCVYSQTKNFPNEEKFCLINQMRRCAVSITSNIAEGFGRNTSKDKAHFYAISKGSALELKNQIILSKDLNYIDEGRFVLLIKDISEVIKMLSGIIRSSKNYS